MIASVFIFWLTGISQTATPVPQQTPDPYASQRRIDEYRRNSQIFETLNKGGQRKMDPQTYQRVYQDYILSLYRESTRSERESLAPDPGDVQRYSYILTKPNTGIVRLIPDIGCASHPQVISAEDQCLKYTMPGNGSSFSFRKSDYRIPRIADIVFVDKYLISPGMLQHSILTRIGDVPIEDVTENSRGTDFVFGFQPAESVKDAVEQNKLLQKGIERDGLHYGRVELVSVDSTYLFRAIAYRGKLYRSVENIVYDEMSFDKRRDVIVAFRVVRLGADGSVTIVWRELKRSESPKLK